MTIRVAVAGLGGRMGREVAAAAAADPEVRLVGGIVRPGSAAAGQALAAITGLAVAGRVTTGPAEILGETDVLIDFTTPEASLVNGAACAAAGRAIVVGTTGLSDAQLGVLRELGETIPVFYARNMSLGLNAILSILPELVRALADYDIEIVETHHRHKADAPSGTSLALFEAIGGELPERRAVHGRQGAGRRARDEIGVHAIRAGGNAGEHTVLLAGEGEEVTITHRAYGRQAFALGALRAAKFLVTRPPGCYSMVDLTE